MRTKTRIVILGAGFSGLSLALKLAKLVKAGLAWEIVLIDKRPYHLFVPNLYSVATGAEELASQQELKKSVALNFEEILKTQPITFELGEVTGVDETQKVVKLSNKQIQYDWLVLALGSKASYLNVPGAENYALPLKTLPDALRIKNAVEFAIQARQYEKQKNKIVIMVAGGGYAGTEIACELASLLDFLAWKYQVVRSQVEVVIIESGKALVTAMGSRSSRAVSRRLSELGVGVKLNSRIHTVREKSVELENGEILNFDVLIWTVGIAGVALPAGLEVPLDKQQRILTDSYLRVQGKHEIFVIGDLAKIIYSAGEVPASAQDAIHQAQYLSRALISFSKNQLPAVYKPKNHGFILAMGKGQAILNIWPIFWQGRLAYLAHEVAQMGYYASIIGWWKAGRYCWFSQNIWKRKN